MFSLINLILTVIILIRIFKYDKFYVVKNEVKVFEEVPKKGLTEKRKDPVKYEKANKNNDNKH